jgi:hypothetical protein
MNLARAMTLERITVGKHAQHHNLVATLSASPAPHHLQRHRQHRQQQHHSVIIAFHIHQFHCVHARVESQG